MKILIRRGENKTEILSEIVSDEKIYSVRVIIHLKNIIGLHNITNAFQEYMYKEYLLIDEYILIKVLKNVLKNRLPQTFRIFYKKLNLVETQVIVESSKFTVSFFQNRDHSNYILAVFLPFKTYSAFKFYLSYKFSKKNNREKTFRP